MKLSLRSALLVATSLTAFTAFGCSNASEPEVDSDQGALEAPTATGSANAHLTAVGKCDKAYTKASNKAVSTNDMIQASAAFGECNKRANDAVVARIEKNLRDAGSPSAGQAAPSIAAFRAAQAALCSEMDKASPNFGGSLSRVEATSCRSSIEVFLAALIDENVALGDEARGMKEDRSHHLGCYKAFDKRLDQAVANNDMVQATHTLARCIQTSAARQPRRRPHRHPERSRGGPRGGGRRPREGRIGGRHRQGRRALRRSQPGRRERNRFALEHHHRLVQGARGRGGVLAAPSGPRRDVSLMATRPTAWSLGMVIA
ncbi:MAG: hypothetical protein IPG50_24235 [Myxococcales bacterium]|nr:hypothetical protein [Myxococcales bacterium]